VQGGSLFIKRGRVGRLASCHCLLASLTEASGSYAYQPPSHAINRKATVSCSAHWRPW